MHDPHTGRFFAVDPLTSKYPYYTPYSFSGNMVIQFVELEGLETGYTRYLDRTFADPKLTVEFHEGNKPFVPYALGVTGGLALVTIGVAAAPAIPYIAPWAYSNAPAISTGTAIAVGFADESGQVQIPGPLDDAGRAARVSVKSLISKGFLNWGDEISDGARMVDQPLQIPYRLKVPPSSFLNSLKTTVSAQKQARHLAGTAEQGKGFLNSIDDAQTVLDAVHSGDATFLGTSKAGHQVFKFEGVTGTNVNLGAGVSEQATNIFMIKGTSSPSVVPTSPLWKP